jgi:heat shock protein HtpX
MSLTSRAVIALALMVGFYALALAMVVFLVWIPYATAVYLRFGAGSIKLAIFCLVAAFIIVKSVLPRRDRFTPPGPELAPDRLPRLFAEIRAAAEAAGQPMPAEVYLVKLGPLIYRTREALVRTVVGLARHSGVVSKPFEWYAHLFFRVTHVVSRHQERQADLLAARIAGPAATARGLITTHRAALAFGAYWAGEVSSVLAAGFRPPLLPGFLRFCAAPPVAADLAAATEQELREAKVDPYDTHPSLRERLAALGEVDPPPGPPSDPPALTLLDSVPELEGELMTALTRDKGAKDYGHKLRGLRPSGIPVLNWAVLGKELADSTGSHGHDEHLAQFTVGAAMALLLVRRGFALDAPPGGPVVLVRDALHSR